MKGKKGDKKTSETFQPNFSPAKSAEDLMNRLSSTVSKHGHSLT